MLFLLLNRLTGTSYIWNQPTGSGCLGNFEKLETILMHVNLIKGGLFQRGCLSEFISKLSKQLQINLHYKSTLSLTIHKK